MAELTRASRFFKRLAGGQTPDLDLVSAIIGVYEQAQRFADAQGALDTAAKNFPDEKQIHFLQGALYERQNKVSEAEQAFRKSAGTGQEQSFGSELPRLHAGGSGHEAGRSPDNGPRRPSIRTPSTAHSSTAWAGSISR